MPLFIIHSRDLKAGLYRHASETPSLLYYCLLISLKINFSKYLCKYAIRAPTSLDPNKILHFVWPDLGPKCLQSRRNQLVPEYKFYLLCLLIG